MTLIVTVVSQTMIWMGADRRLTEGQDVVSSDAIKLMHLTTRNSDGTIGYAGQGAKYPVIHTNEISQWLKRCLRGVDCDYHTAVNIITKAAEKRILLRKHGFVLAGFVDDKPVITFIARDTGVSVKNLNGGATARQADGCRTFGYRHTLPEKEHLPMFALFGSGAIYSTMRTCCECCAWLGRQLQ